MFIDSEKRLKQLSDEAKKNTEDLEEAKKNCCTLCAVQGG